ncbi:MAG: hypothetical protein IJ829_05170 [Kiritimatiellae bacterium]|nr:hypothetical protein [Kiritimatiellia bacterium]
MKIDAAEYSSKRATPEEIKALIADDAKRGEFMILEQDGGDFLQVAGDAAADGFTLEYSEGGRLFRCPRPVAAGEAEGAFLDYLDRLDSWKGRFAWEAADCPRPRTGLLAALARFFGGS